jgi:hypothetical protein
MVGVLAVVGSGCVLGPTALEVSRVQYNEVIGKTTDEQLLLNLVRLQYRESPLFLDVGSVSAQFEFAEGASISGTMNEGPNPVNPDVLGLGATTTLSEKPTITFAPLQGRDFVSQLLSPLTPEAILQLSHSGWSIDRVLRLTVQRINGLDNASRASGPTPDDAPEYEDFARVSQALRELQKQGLLIIGYELREEPTGISIPIGAASVTDVIDAQSRGYAVRVDPTGPNLLLTGRSDVLVWRIPDAAVGSPEVREIVELLGLDPRQQCYTVKVSIGGRPEPGVSPGERKQVNIATRSLMGALFYLSQAVEVPEAHRSAGVVTNTRTPEGEAFDWAHVTGDLLRIHSQRTPPRHAAVAVRYRGYWFSIDDRDLTSKSTFGFLRQLFALQAGAIETKAPVLTLPVGG